MRIGRLSCVLYLIVRANAQNCDGLLQHGIYDLRHRLQTADSASSFIDWYCQDNSSTQQTEDRFGSSLAAVIKNFPVKLGFDSKRDSFSTWKTHICQRTQVDRSLQEKFDEFENTINPGIVQAWEKCTLQDGLHVWLEPGPDPHKFLFRTIFHSPTDDGKPTTIRKVDLGSNVKCSDLKTPFQSSGAGPDFVCTRNNDEPVLMAVRAASHPNGNLQLPAIALKLHGNANCQKWDRAGNCTQCVFPNITFSGGSQSGSTPYTCDGMRDGGKVHATLDGPFAAPGYDARTLQFSVGLGFDGFASGPGSSLNEFRGGGGGTVHLSRDATSAESNTAYFGFGYCFTGASVPAICKTTDSTLTIAIVK